MTTTVGLGTTWLASRLEEFIELFPNIRLQLLLNTTANWISACARPTLRSGCASRSSPTSSRDVCLPCIFTFTLLAKYLKRYGTPSSVADLQGHRLITFGKSAPPYLRNINWLETVVGNDDSQIEATLEISNVVAIKRAVEGGAGIAMLPDYLIERETTLVQLISDAEVPTFDCYFAYPEELRNSARIRAFRDFIVSQAERWRY